MFKSSVVPLSKAAFDALNNGGGMSVLAFDAAVAGGMSFLQAELEKRDPKIREPLTSVTWQRDIVVKTGGGWVDWTSVFNVDYGTTGPNMYGLMGGETNNIPTMQANIAKDMYPVFTWGNVMKVPLVDQNKLQQIGRSLDDLLDKGIRLNYNKALDLMCYQGFGGYGGITNNSNITAVAVALNAAATSRAWADKTPDEILNDIDGAIVATWAASEYDITGMANYILIPPAQYAYINRTKISTAGNVSILTYLMENNIATKQGQKLEIMPSRWCVGAGEEMGSPAVATDRMIAYVNDEDRLYMDITVPIQRAMTMPNVNEAAYLTLYLAQLGVPKFLYYTPAIYCDGI